MSSTYVNMKREGRWKRSFLVAAGIYHIVWGLAEILFPDFLFRLLGIDVLNYAPVWQSIGLFMGVFGIGYLLASRDPDKNWPLVLLGFLMGSLGSVGIIGSFLAGSLPASFSAFILLNNLLWLVPFGYILYDVYDAGFREDRYLVDLFSKYDEMPLEMFETSEGLNLDEMSYKWPTMVVFLRHFGCTFCREALQDLREQRDKIEVRGTRIVIVHMSDDKTAFDQLRKYELEDIPHISDPEQILYKRFRLRKGGWWQLMGLKVLGRGIFAGLFKGHGLGKPAGDVSQMPGVFMLNKGKVLRQFVHKTAADRPDYASLAR